MGDIRKHRPMILRHMNRPCHASRSTTCEYARRIAYVCTTTAPEPSSDTVLYHAYTWMTTVSLPGAYRESFSSRIPPIDPRSFRRRGRLGARCRGQMGVKDACRFLTMAAARTADADVLPGWRGGHVRGRNVPFDNTIDNLPWSEMAAYTCRQQWPRPDD